MAVVAVLFLCAGTALFLPQRSVSHVRRFLCAIKYARYTNIIIIVCVPIFHLTHVRIANNCVRKLRRFVSFQ